MTTQTTTPPERFYKRAQELVDLINSRRHQPAYASNISDVAQALWAQYERGQMMGKNND